MHILCVNLFKVKLYKFHIYGYSDSEVTGNSRIL